MEDERRRDERIWFGNEDGSSTATTVREAVRDHESRIKSLERWQVRTEVYERLIRWTLTIATAALVVGLINVWLNVIFKG